MTPYDKTKFKACAPEDTVNRIRALLDGLGIRTLERFGDSGVEGFYSVRIEIQKTGFGQNGKGTTRAYALASGYAELMERLQTGFLFQCDLDMDTARHMGFSHVPDEVRAAPEELAGLGGTLLKETLRRIRISDGGMGFVPINAAAELNKWLFDSPDGKLCALPFTRLKDGVREYLPHPLYHAYYFTNGSCAGNTRAEALVQGMSEIFERYAAERILKLSLTPPEISDVHIEAHAPALMTGIRDMRNRPGIRLRIMDASCGIGLPVVASALIDERRGSYVLRFGAHPHFGLALERSLTEILQGRNIDSFNNAVLFDLCLDDYAQGDENRFCFAKAAQGVYPSDLFADTPSWPFAAFQDAPETIDGQLNQLLIRAEQLEFDIYVRDCSFLGFPTYHIVAPGKSMVFDFGSKRLSERRLRAAARPALRSPTTASDNALAAALRYARRKRGWILENSYTYLSGLPISPKILGLLADAGLIYTLLLAARGEYADAAGIAKCYAHRSNGLATPVAPLHQLLAAAARGIEIEHVQGVLRALYPDEWVLDAVTAFRAPLKALPDFACHHCNECTERFECQYPEIARIERALRAAMVQYSVI